MKIRGEILAKLKISDRISPGVPKQAL